MSSRPLVDRCLCCAVTFARGLEVARQHDANSVEQLQRWIDISSGCGLCTPYMQKAIETGTVLVPLMEEDESREFRSRAGRVTDRNSRSADDRD